MADDGYGDPLAVLKLCAFAKERQQEWRSALEYYEKMYLIYEASGDSKASMYESVAQNYRQLGEHGQHRKYLSMALEEYRREGDERKISELSWVERK